MTARGALLRVIERLTLLIAESPEDDDFARERRSCYDNVRLDVEALLAESETPEEQLVRVTAELEAMGENRDAYKAQCEVLSEQVRLLREGTRPAGWTCPTCGLSDRRYYEQQIARLKKVEAELITTDQLLSERQRVLEAIPHCPDHGVCIPHAMGWIRDMKVRHDHLP